MPDLHATLPFMSAIAHKIATMLRRPLVEIGPDARYGEPSGPRPACCSVGVLLPTSELSARVRGNPAAQRYYSRFLSNPCWLCHCLCLYFVAQLFVSTATSIYPHELYTAFTSNYEVFQAIF